MALVGYMNGLPIFSKYLEAVAWGKNYGLTGAHKHIRAKKVVYMPGETHDQITSVLGETAEEVRVSISQNTPPPQQQVVTPQQPQITPPPATPTTGGGGY